MNAVLIGFLTTGTTLAVTVALFTAEWIRRRIVAYRDNRRAIITRVLETLDRAFRGYARKTVLPIGTSVEVEYTILLPRLLVDLPKKDRMVATWVAAEIQRMQSQISDTKAFAVAAEVSSKLVDWYHHDLNRDWFTKALRAHPYDEHFVVPLRARAGRMWDAGTRWFVIIGLATVVMVVIGFAVRSFRKKP